MEKVKVKQVDGAVDVSNSQTIKGEKTFVSPINIQSAGIEKGGQIIRIEGSWIYWVYDITKLNEEGCRKSEFKGFIIALAKDAIYNSTSNLTNQQLDEIMPYLNITEIITTKESDVKLSLIAKFIYNRIRE